MYFMELIWQTRRTQNISSIGLFYNNWEILLGRCLTVKNQWRLSQEAKEDPELKTLYWRNGKLSVFL